RRRARADAPARRDPPRSEARQHLPRARGRRSALREAARFRHREGAPLGPEQRSIIDLAYFHGYTQDEISKELDIPLGTVKTRMRAAIIELRKILDYS
ncbi:MAG TPA: sigma factor-like helix-turn-helix DNA-binding protein, partial [Ferruginibacter sp.]|nr:sigma factor-like helix-turn-helix DNA-binding protein [Ferruginibacter sp.]